VNNDDFDKAIDQYKKAIDASPTPGFQGIVTHNLGYTYYLKKEYLKSVNFFNQAYDLNQAWGRHSGLREWPITGCGTKRIRSMNGNSTW
jgi:tetratricopeptide (TPR) repeat protein